VLPDRLAQGGDLGVEEVDVPQDPADQQINSVFETPNRQPSNASISAGLLTFRSRCSM